METMTKKEFYEQANDALDGFFAPMNRYEKREALDRLWDRMGWLCEQRVVEGDQFSTLRGCRDMLRESAKQFRLLKDNGHAVMADRHADAADAVLLR